MNTQTQTQTQTLIQIQTRIQTQPQAQTQTQREIQPQASINQYVSAFKNKLSVHKQPMHRHSKQLSFAAAEFAKKSGEHGGSLLKNRRKSARPLSSKHALHLVLKVNSAPPKENNAATPKTINSTPPKNINTAPPKTFHADAPKTSSLKKHKKDISLLLDKYSQKFGIKIYKYAIAGNHIHILLLSSHRLMYRSWIRTITGQLSLRFRIKWGLRPWSRILSWGRDFVVVSKYLWQNILESEGIIAYQPRKNRLHKSSLER